MTTPEIKDKEQLAAPEIVSEIPEQVEITPGMVSQGVQPTQTQFTAQVTDDQGRQIIQTPETQTVTIRIPNQKEILEQEVKGSPYDSKTWGAMYFLRVIKKALHFGWKIVFGE
jgi:hypothetical protein